MIVAASDVPPWGQYGAVGILLAAAVVWWRYSIAEISTARTEARTVWERLATEVLPILGRAAMSVDHSATTTERALAVIDQATSVIKSERSQLETTRVALLEEQLKTARLRAELAEERARGHGGI